MRKGQVIERLRETLAWPAHMARQAERAVVVFATAKRVRLTVPPGAMRRFRCRRRELARRGRAGAHLAVAAHGGGRGARSREFSWPASVDRRTWRQRRRSEWQWSSGSHVASDA